MQRSPIRRRRRPLAQLRRVLTRPGNLAPALYGMLAGGAGSLSLAITAPTALAAAASMVSLLGGLVLFTLIEYSVHRWLFHGAERWGSPRLYRFLHGAHHDRPRDVTRLAVPLTTSLPLLALVLASWLPWAALRPQGAAMTAGLLVGMLVYERIHEHTHRTPERGEGAWMWRRRVDHLQHHHRAHGNFGVTTALWDVVFGTQLRRRRRGAR